MKIKLLAFIIIPSLIVFVAVKMKFHLGKIDQSSEAGQCIYCYLNEESQPSKINDFRDIIKTFPRVENSEFISKYLCKDQIDMKRLCKLNTEYCLKTIGSKDCTIERNDVEKIQTHSAIRKNTFELFLNKFRTLSLSESLSNTCCKDDQACKRTFNEKSLLLLNGTKDSLGQYGYYWEDKGIIGVYSDRAIELGTSENIESFLLHELGHACIYSIARDYGDMTQQSSIQWVKHQLNARFDQQTFNCVNSALQKRISINKNRDAVVWHWYDEVFADLVFAKFRDKVGHYAVDCHYDEDSTHALPTVYFDCWVKSQQYRREICGK